ncbi:hypothetical protein [Glycomyces xiaoerkulensis]|uniref:hypothetical protein n=1 Tax=Glycomyces xiaoerkulensis TaxID=2038139 RepID=UPI000C25D4DA|nr:hypothetical protein [Glycomyces xiaoerkulensis]
MRHSLRLTAAAGACALAFGLAACSGDDEPADPDEPTATTEAADTGTTEATEDATAEATESAEPESDPRLEAFEGEWDEDVEKLGSSLSIDADGNVVMMGEGGPFEGTIVLGDAEAHRLELTSTAGGASPTTLDWELEYDPAADAINVVDTRDDGVYERVFVRAL